MNTTLTEAPETSQTENDISQKRRLELSALVEWKNNDLVPQTATSTSFNPGTIRAGQLCRHTFTDAGNFPYVCTFRPQMKGGVIVKQSKERNYGQRGN